MGMCGYDGTAGGLLPASLMDIGYPAEFIDARRRQIVKDDLVDKPIMKAIYVWPVLKVGHSFNDNIINLK